MSSSITTTSPATPSRPRSHPGLALIDRLTAIVGSSNILANRDELLVYECDGYMLERTLPDVVVFPTCTEQVAAVVKLCNELGVPFVPRGAGTSLAGGTLAVGGGVMICLTRMRRIVEINHRDRYAIVEAGVVNVWLTRALAGTGLHYAPDPSSQTSCTIGGNVGTNSGGPHTLKYGVTVNHVLGVEMVMPDGSIVWFGGPTRDNPGYDLTGLMVGNEGTFGICTQAIVNLARDPEAGRTFLVVFDSIDACAQTISGLIASGIVPAALEMLDNLMINAVERAFKMGFPTNAQSLLIIELDGLEAGMDREARAVEAIVAQHGGQLHKSVAFRTRQEPEYKAIWKARKSAFGAIGRISPTYCTQDGVVPRTQLPHILRQINRIAQDHDLRIANVFHAGDGNIHPIVLFDERDPDQVRRALSASRALLEECIKVGGSVSGEHGIGVEKLEFMSKLFTHDDLEVMAAVRDALNPKGLCSPNKLVPIGCGCVERTHPGRRGAA